MKTVIAPTLSIIIPAYNASKTISRVIEHIISQSFEDFELIIINDGSKDDTLDILSSYRDSRVIIITQENSGASTARNRGIENARGKYIMFIDADDDFEPDFILKMVTTIEKQKSELVVCGHSGDGVRSILPDKNGLIDKNLPKHVCSSVLKNGLLYAPWNKIYLSEILKEKNIRFKKNVGFGEDLIFNFNYLKYTKSIYYIKEPLYKYIYRPSGLSAKTASNMNYRYEMLAALRDYLGEGIKKPDIAIKYQLIRARWIISVQKAKLKQGKS